MTYFWEDWWPLFAVFALIAALIGGGIWWAIRTERAWERYAADHHCQRTGETERYTYTTLMYCGKNCWMPQVHTGTRYEYKCDNGERVWR
jgi:hypothetical protein